MSVLPGVCHSRKGKTKEKRHVAERYNAGRVERNQQNVKRKLFERDRETKRVNRALYPCPGTCLYFHFTLSRNHKLNLLVAKKKRKKEYGNPYSN